MRFSVQSVGFNLNPKPRFRLGEGLGFNPLIAGVGRFIMQPLLLALVGYAA